MIEYYKVYKEFEIDAGLTNNIEIDIICQTQDWVEANNCYKKVLDEFYKDCIENVENENIQFLTENVNDNRTNKEILLSEITSIYSNLQDRWWHKPVLEKVTIEFFNKYEDKNS